MCFARVTRPAAAILVFWARTSHQTLQPPQFSALPPPPFLTHTLPLPPALGPAKLTPTIRQYLLVTDHMLHTL